MPAAKPAAKRKLREAITPQSDPDRRHAARARRRRLIAPPASASASAPPPSRDILSPLSDELILRIFSFLDVRCLVDISPVSRRFCTLAGDSQLWRVLYHQHFLLRPLCALSQPISLRASPADIAAVIAEDAAPPPGRSIDWKRRYKLRHNWARGQCAVQEVQVSDHGGPLHPDSQTLLRVADGLAITADLRYGMRAWDLHAGTMIAHAAVEKADGAAVKPTAIALDAQKLSANGSVDIMLGFNDGVFGLWRLDVAEGTLRLVYRQEKSHVGPLVSVAYCHPYAMTGTELGFISIFTFAPPEPTKRDEGDTDSPDDHNKEADEMREPRLLKQLRSYYSRMPLALSISPAQGSVIASAAYTFSAVGGWAIGVQDFAIPPHDGPITSRVAYTSPVESSPSTSRRPRHAMPSGCACGCADEGPTRLVYSHPYLLATMPDNTLMMHLTTAAADSVAISRGVRLWGHTSAIADADVTPRGKAVSISLKGNELRVWELGRLASSVEVRPRQGRDWDEVGSASASASSTPVPFHLADRTSWVGFDREMIVVLRVGLNGRENMVVYDFT